MNIAGQEPFVTPQGTRFELRAATPSAGLLAKRLQNGGYRHDQDGQLEKQCAQCMDYWPADTEFFYTAKTGDGLHTWCKACYQAWRQAKKDKA
ncbi:MAG TPA: hypothetical protein VK165_20265 [Azonexus sp.]|nr:hypothetical protein [Azonexus sp.]